MRISGLLGANRRFPLHDLAGTDWQMFIFDELRLRYNPLGLTTWTFFTDSIFATCFNKCPEITVSEMTGDLPCEESLFEAETVSEYESSVARLPSAASRPQSLSKLTAYFLADADPNLEIKHPFNPSATELLLCITALGYDAMMCWKRVLLYN
ncbi:hypothetical protein CEP53_008509 [Fusarium sp. AF-6]|nr:hypothetical protein CEP53_008509 [Fusarium sp. AF-6]